MAKRRASSASTPRSAKSSRNRKDPKSDPGSNPITPTPSSADSSAVSKSPKSVLLGDWWLTKVHGTGLGVTGFETTGSEPRVFASGAIATRHDPVTVEAVDGTMVTIIGSINRSRTQQNGFSLEVCNQFQIGFPFYWEDYAVALITKGSTGTHHSIGASSKLKNNSNSSSDTLGPFSLDDIPVNRLRDFLMSPLAHSEDCSKEKLLEDTLARFKSERNQAREQSDAENENPITGTCPGKRGVDMDSEGVGNNGKTRNDLTRNLRRRSRTTV